MRDYRHKKMDLKILKIDLDVKYKEDAVQIITDRLIFLTKLDIIPYKNIESIMLVHKLRYSCKIYFNKDLSEEYIIILQLLLGSDWQKEAMTFYRHYVTGANNSNWLYDIKRYPDNTYKQAEYIDISEEVFAVIEDNLTQ